ncbi:MucB/RseB C-terminal domain-containing protein [Panacagrimonas sp.]|uniref:MucB/RseB C-terminal domain-containing protein n=1 Tax=Panacagrimonas sp. TaxID=2480088 RepID=UPI003B51AD97
MSPRAKSRWAVGAIALSLIGSVASAADAVPGEWLVRMSEATRLANYEGVVVYRGDDVLETFRVTHRFADGSERERVQSMTGEVREVLKQNDKLTCLLPKDRHLTATRPASTPKGLFRALTPERLQQIARVYELREIGTARVAGRICRGIAIAPRDEFRYGYEIWADDATGLPLKLSLVAPDGRLLEQMFFTEVRFPDSIPDSAFDAEIPVAEVRESTEAAVDAIAQAHEREPMTEEQAAAVAAEAAEPAFSQLPPGFRVIRREIRASPAGVREHLVLSDGLSAVSVYRIQRRQAPTAGSGQRLDQMGPLNAYSRMVGTTQVMVLGEAPRRTIRMIGDSFEPRDLAPAPPTLVVSEPGEAAAGGAVDR